MEQITGIGITLAVIGIVIIIIGALLSAGKQNAGENPGNINVKSAGIVMIGPIPLMFGDQKLLLPLILLTIVLMVVAFFTLQKGFSAG